MEHPKDVGDRSTLAIISVLVPIGHLPVLHRGALRVDPPKNNQSTAFASPPTTRSAAWL